MAGRAVSGVSAARRGNAVLVALLLTAVTAGAVLWYLFAGVRGASRGTAAQVPRLILAADSGLAVARAAAAASWADARGAVFAKSPASSAWFVLGKESGLPVEVTLARPVPRGTTRESGTDLRVRNQHGFYNEVLTLMSTTSGDASGGERIEAELVSPTLLQAAAAPR